MLEEFSYLGKKKAYEVVVTNTNLVASWCEELKPLPDGLFAPKLENSAEELYSLVWGKPMSCMGRPTTDRQRSNRIGAARHHRAEV